NKSSREFASGGTVAIMARLRYAGATRGPKLSSRWDHGLDPGSRRNRMARLGRKQQEVTVVAAPARSSVGQLLAVSVIVALAVLFATGKIGELFPSLPNPFGSHSVDRSQPPLLESLVDLNRYEAASANFQVIVDEEKDADWMPSFIRGERTVFVAGGSVEAAVDFSQVNDRSITVSDDRRSVTLVLPAPILTEPRVDPQESKVVSRDRGLLDRVGSVFSDTPTGEHDLYLAAEHKMEVAAAASDLRPRAERNTRTMLEGMLRSLGFTNVTVNFAPSPQ
ncbi:MAG TPA: DUF4230 domain-containing protein, partial [Acidimicrobiales bacterium]|nr:DUF4230 domain-containing protein [Acidimicrobiales bacterium]